MSGSVKVSFKGIATPLFHVLNISETSEFGGESPIINSERIESFHLERCTVASIFCMPDLFSCRELSFFFAPSDVKYPLFAKSPRTIFLPAFISPSFSIHFSTLHCMLLLICGKPQYGLLEENIAHLNLYKTNSFVRRRRKGRRL